MFSESEMILNTQILFTAGYFLERNFSMMSQGGQGTVALPQGLTVLFWQTLGVQTSFWC